MRGDRLTDACKGLRSWYVHEVRRLHPSGRFGHFAAGERREVTKMMAAMRKVCHNG